MTTAWHEGLCTALSDVSRSCGDELSLWQRDIGFLADRDDEVFGDFRVAQAKPAFCELAEFHSSVVTYIPPDPALSSSISLDPVPRPRGNL